MEDGRRTRRETGRVATQVLLVVGSREQWLSEIEMLANFSHSVNNTGSLNGRVQGNHWGGD